MGGVAPALGQCRGGTMAEHHQWTGGNTTRQITAHVLGLKAYSGLLSVIARDCQAKPCGAVLVGARLEGGPFRDGRDGALERAGGGRGEVAAQGVDHLAAHVVHQVDAAGV